MYMYTYFMFVLDYNSHTLTLLTSLSKANTIPVSIWNMFSSSSQVGEEGQLPASWLTESEGHH